MAKKGDVSADRQVGKNQGPGDSGTDLLTDKTGPESRERRKGKGAQDRTKVRQVPKKKKGAGEGD